MEEHANGKLLALDEPQVSTVEAIGLRLYTGPLFVKYNSVLRGLNSQVPFLQTQLVGLCCSTEVSGRFAAGELSFAQSKATANTYTTTLHVINSGIVKTSKLTFACRVQEHSRTRHMPQRRGCTR